MIRVVNKRTFVSRYPDQEFYCGRGSVLGNLATSIQNRPTQARVVCQSREESIAWYKNWLDAEIKAKNAAVCAELNRLYKAAKRGDIWLICYCKPQACHGDVIKELLEGKLHATPTSDPG